MTPITIPTARLELVLQMPAEVLALVEQMSPADRAEVSPDWLARARAANEGDPWALFFSIIENDSGTVVGSCGFKGPPDPDGVVELAYSIDAAYRERGYATESAEALARFAFNSGLVRKVCAHTKSDSGASARVLTKCGFGHVGEVVDPEDGLVCRWELVQESAESLHCRNA